MGQDDPRIGQQAAPVAGVMPALAQSTTRSIMWPPRAPRNIVGRSGAMRGPSEAISTSACRRPPCAPRKTPAAQRSHFLSHLDQHLHVEAEPAAFGQHRCERRDVHPVLALVVGSSAAVDALAFDGDRPWRQALRHACRGHEPYRHDHRSGWSTKDGSSTRSATRNGGPAGLASTRDVNPSGRAQAPSLPRDRSAAPAHSGSWLPPAIATRRRRSTSNAPLSK